MYATSVYTLLLHVNTSIRSSDKSGRFPVFHLETDANAIQEAHHYTYCWLSSWMVYCSIYIICFRNYKCWRLVYIHRFTMYNYCTYLRRYIAKHNSDKDSRCIRECEGRLPRHCAVFTTYAIVQGSCAAYPGNQYKTSVLILVSFEWWTNIREFKLTSYCRDSQ